MQLGVFDVCPARANEPLEKKQQMNTRTLYETGSQLMSCVLHGHGRLRNTHTVPGPVEKNGSVSSSSEVTAHYSCWTSSSKVKQTALLKKRKKWNNDLL